MMTSRQIKYGVVTYDETQLSKQTSNPVTYHDNDTTKQTQVATDTLATTQHMYSDNIEDIYENHIWQPEMLHMQLSKQKKRRMTIRPSRAKTGQQFKRQKLQTPFDDLPFDDLPFDDLSTENVIHDTTITTLTPTIVTHTQTSTITTEQAQQHDVNFLTTTEQLTTDSQYTTQQQTATQEAQTSNVEQETTLPRVARTLDYNIMQSIRQEHQFQEKQDEIEQYYLSRIMYLHIDHIWKKLLCALIAGKETFQFTYGKQQQHSNTNILYMNMKFIVALVSQQAACVAQPTSYNTYIALYEHCLRQDKDMAACVLYKVHHRLNHQLFMLTVLHNLNILSAKVSYPKDTQQMIDINGEYKAQNKPQTRLKTTTNIMNLYNIAFTMQSAHYEQFIFILETMYWHLHAVYHNNINITELRNMVFDIIRQNITQLEISRYNNIVSIISRLYDTQCTHIRSIQRYADLIFIYIGNTSIRQKIQKEINKLLVNYIFMNMLPTDIRSRLMYY